MILVTFEGIDGSGKSTQAQLLLDRLEAEGYAAELVREPGGSALSERVRSILLDPSLHVQPFAELLLFSAARSQLVAERIRPALKKGVVVVCDRFSDSTTAYQGAGRGIGEWDWIRRFNSRVTDGLEPDRTYLIRLGVDEALRRRSVRSPADRMERSGGDFYARVAAAYDRLADEEPERIIVLDGKRSIDELANAVWTDLQEVLPEGTVRSA